MKPIKLSIEGLNSFVSSETIDFKDLSQDGIFGIFGPTGSGKSTILDAIVLALYGKINRSKTNDSFINLKSKKAEVDFEFSFGKNKQEKCYRVLRTFKRNSKKPQEVVQTAQLFEVGSFGSKQIMEGANKVDEQIVKLLGLKCDEFSKCIALPQGEFASFLKARPSERVKIIGDIFDLNRYGESLNIKLKDQLNKTEGNVNVIEAKIEQVGQITTEDVANKKIEKTALETKIALLVAEQEKLDSTINEESEVLELTQQLDSVETELKNYETVSKEIEIKSEALDKIKLVVSNKPILLQTEELSSKLSNYKQELAVSKKMLIADEERHEVYMAESNKELEELKVNIETKVARLQKLESLKDIEKQLLGSKEIKDNLELELKSIRSNIDSINKKLASKSVDKSMQLNRIDEIDSEISKIQESAKNFGAVMTYDAIDGFVKELLRYKSFVEEKRNLILNEISEDVKNLEILKNKKHENINEIENLYSKYGLNYERNKFGLLKTREALMKEREKFSNIVNHIQICSDKQRECKNKAESQKETMKQLVSEKEKLDLEFENVEQELDSLNSELLIAKEKYDLEISKNGLNNIVRSLKVGDNCPICGNDIYAKSHGLEIDTMSSDIELKRIKNEIEDEETVLRDLSYKLGRNTREQEVVSNNVEILKTEFDQLVTEKKKYVAELTDFGMISSISDIDKIEQALTENEEQLSKDLKEERSLFDELTKNECKIEVCMNSMQYKQKKSADLSNLIDSLSESIKEKDQVVLSIVSQGADLKQQLNEYKNLNSKLENLTISKDKLNIGLETIVGEIKSLEIECATLEEREVQLSKQNKDNDIVIQDCLSKLNCEVSTSVEESIKFEDRELLNLKQRQKNIEDIRYERVETIAVEKNEVSQLSAMVKSLSEEYKKLAKESLVILKKCELDSIKDAKVFMLEDDEVKLLEKEIANHNKGFDNLMQKKEELTSKLKNRVVSVEILENLKKKKVSVITSISDNNALFGRVCYELETMINRLEQYEKLKKELVEESKKYDMLKDLQQCLKNKALMEYVAEEYMIDISNMATAKIQLLMDGKYNLQYKDKEFYIQDNFNDGALRPVESLSGGEMFVVSLALALSISDAIVSNTDKSFDFFFLDEGFGTLDRDYCEYIINCLLKLEQKNLTIGLISHIPELQERVCQKLLVTKTEQGSKLKRVSDI